MSNNLSVKITASIEDLQAKFAIARAEVSGLSREMNQLARASVNGGLDAAASARLQQVAGDFVHAKAAAAELSNQLRGVHESSGGMGEALEEVRNKLAGAFAVTGIAAAAEGITRISESIQQLGERAIEISSLSEVLDVSTGQFQAMQVAAEEAGTSAEVFARANEKLANMLTEARSGSAAAIQKLHELGVTTRDIADPHFQLNELLGVLRTRLTDANSAEETRKALLVDLGGRMAAAILAIKAYDGSLEGVAEANRRVNALSPQTIASLKEESLAWSELWTKVKNAASSVVAFGREMSNAGKARLNLDSPQSNSGPQQAEAAQQIAIAQDTARQQEAIHNQVLKSEMDSIKEGVAAFAQGSAQRLAALQRYAQLAKQYYGGANVEEVRRANSEVLAEERAFNDAQGRDAIASARERIAEIGSVTRVGTLQRLEAERDVWATALATAREGSEAQKEIALDLARSQAAIVKESAAQAQTITRQDVDTDIEISRMKIDAEKERLDAIDAQDAAAAGRKLERLRTLTAQEFALNLDALNSELSTLQEGTAEYDAVYDKIRVLKEKLVLDLAKLDNQYQQELKRNLKEESEAWKSTKAEIENAEGTLIGDIINKRKNLAQSLQQIGLQMVQQEITNDAKAYTSKIIFHDATKALEQGGLLYHKLITAAKTADEVSAQTGQTTALTAGNTARQSADAAAAAANKAQQVAIDSSAILGSAAVAAAGAFAATAAIPYVGPELAPAAAAAAYSQVAAYTGLVALATGTNYVPQDMPALLHQGEAVVPRKYNPAAGGMGRASGGGDTHHHWTINAMDGASVQRVLDQNMGHIMKGIAREMRRGRIPT